MNRSTQRDINLLRIIFAFTVSSLIFVLTCVSSDTLQPEDISIDNILEVVKVDHDNADNQNSSKPMPIPIPIQASENRQRDRDRTQHHHHHYHHHKSLPDLSNGGIVLFFHIPTTGDGSTISRLASENDKIELHGCQEGDVDRNLSMSQIRDMVTKWSTDSDIVGPGGKVKFLEFPWDSDPFSEMIGDIRTWRENAKQNYIPFFVFTMLRDPLDAYISTYDYFCIKNNNLHNKREGGQQMRLKPELEPKLDCPLLHEHNMDKILEISRDNTQSRYLCYATVLDLMMAAGGSSSRLHLNRGNNDAAAQNKSIQEGCVDDIVHLVEDNMDWVGVRSEFMATIGAFLSMGIDLGITKKIMLEEHEHEAETYKQDGGSTELERGESNSTSIRGYLSQTTVDMVMSKLLSEDRRLVDWAKETYTLASFQIDPQQIVNRVQDIAAAHAMEREKK